MDSVHNNVKTVLHKYHRFKQWHAIKDGNPYAYFQSGGTYDERNDQEEILNKTLSS